MELFSTGKKGDGHSHHTKTLRKPERERPETTTMEERIVERVLAHLRGEKPENHDSQEREPKGGNQTPAKRTTTSRNKRKKEKRREKRMEASKQTETRDTPPPKGIPPPYNTNPRHEDRYPLDTSAVKEGKEENRETRRRGGARTGNEPKQSG